MLSSFLSPFYLLPQAVNASTKFLYIAGTYIGISTRTHIYKKCTTNTVHWLVIGQNQTKNTTCLIISQNGQPKCPIKAVIFYAYTIIKCFNDVCPRAFLIFGDLLKHTSTNYTHCV